MKRTIIRIMIICMLIGFSISPFVLKSQSIQDVARISSITNPFNPVGDAVSLIPAESVKTDSINSNNDFSKQQNSATDKMNPIRIQTSEKKIKRKSYRNMPITIQSRI